MARRKTRRNFIGYFFAFHFALSRHRGSPAAGCGYAAMGSLRPLWLPPISDRKSRTLVLEQLLFGQRIHGVGGHIQGVEQVESRKRKVVDRIGIEEGCVLFDRENIAG